MYEIEYLVLLFSMASMAGFINVMAGGGSSLTLPILILMGLDAPIANGTNRMAILTMTISAVYSMKREQVSDFKFSTKMSLFTLPGAAIGAYLATLVSNDDFKSILAYVMIFIIISILLPKSFKKRFIETFSHYPKLIYIAMIFIGFYGGFIQVGVGFLLMLALESILNINLIKVNMHKVFIVLIYNIPAIIIFIFSDNVDYLLALILSSGMGLGAWFSAKLAIKKGEKLIKVFLIIAIALVTLKLFNIY